MYNIRIINLANYSLMDPKTLFGEDVSKLFSACRKILDNHLHPYEGCYCSHPSASELRRTLFIPQGSNFATVRKSFLKQWYIDHPDEAQKMEASRKEWEEQRTRQFLIVYGIAKRHGLHLRWHANSTPSYADEWEIYKNHTAIARILC